MESKGAVTRRDLFHKVLVAITLVDSVLAIVFFALFMRGDAEPECTTSDDCFGEFTCQDDFRCSCTVDDFENIPPSRNYKCDPAGTSHPHYTWLLPWILTSLSAILLAIYLCWKPCVKEFRNAVSERDELRKALDKLEKDLRKEIESIKKKQ